MAPFLAGARRTLRQVATVGFPCQGVFLVRAASRGPPLLQRPPGLLRLYRMDHRANLLERNEDIQDLIASIHRVAVLGIKTEEQSSQPAFYVPQYLHRAGFDVIPVPVYYPDVTEILGKPVYRHLADIPGAVDLVNVFRRPRGHRAPPRRHAGRETRRGSGFSPASATRRWPRRWRGRASGWSRTADSWWITGRRRRPSDSPARVASAEGEDPTQHHGPRPPQRRS